MDSNTQNLMGFNEDVKKVINETVGVETKEGNKRIVDLNPTEIQGRVYLTLRLAADEDIQASREPVELWKLSTRVFQGLFNINALDEVRLSWHEKLKNDSYFKLFEIWLIRSTERSIDWGNINYYYSYNRYFDDYWSNPAIER